MLHKTSIRMSIFWTPIISWLPKWQIDCSNRVFHHQEYYSNWAVMCLNVSTLDYTEYEHLSLVIIYIPLWSLSFLIFKANHQFQNVLVNVTGSVKTEHNRTSLTLQYKALMVHICVLLKKFSKFWMFLSERRT